MNARVVLFLLLLPLQSFAQGFAGLGGDAEGFHVPEPGHLLLFPRDHGSHPEFRIEWWYVTANLRDEAGNPMGLQWTLFRQASRQGHEDDLNSTQIWMGHAGLTTKDDHYSAETFARGGTGQAGTTTSPFNAYIDDWEIRSRNAGIEQIDLRASGLDFSYQVELNAKGPLVLHGDGGFSEKSDQGQASYYYSQPFYELKGSVTIEGEKISVTGSAWLDREWSSQPLAPDQTGWDWFSLHFESGERLMAFRLRGSKAFTSGTWIDADGTTMPLQNGAMTFSPLEEHLVDGHDIPVRWRIELPERGLNIETKAVNPDAYMAMIFPYWEGPISFEGSHTGVGYLEMTGY